MRILLSAILAATPTPSGSADPANTFYSPGTVGFIATFGVTAAAILLIFDMVRRVRRVRYRAEITERLDAEASKAETQTKPAPAAQKVVKKAAPSKNAKPARPAPPAKPKR
jgi:hypothetical protein